MALETPQWMGQSYTDRNGWENGEERIRRGSRGLIAVLLR